METTISKKPAQKGDSLGDRMKGYENVNRHLLTRRSYVMCRIDGKAFHSYTKGLNRPFDDDLMEDMDLTAAYLCKNIQGAKFAYIQSDEISILLTDFEELGTEAWFDNTVEKMTSVSASMATREFNRLRVLRKLLEGMKNGCDGLDFTTYYNKIKLAEFDSRVFVLPYKDEVINYMLWRQQDATRNSISSVAQSMFSPKELHKANTDMMQEMMFQKDGTNWNNFAPRYKRGRFIVKENYTKEVDTTNPKASSTSSIRTRWTSTEPPIFSKDRSFLDLKIPNNPPDEIE